MAVLKQQDVIFPKGPRYAYIEDFQLFDIMAESPVKDNLVGSYFLGSRNVDPLYNFANPELPLLQTGRPVYSRQYADMTHGNHFDTRIKLTDTMTIVAILQYPDSSASAGRFPVVSNYFKDNTGAVTGDTLMWGGSGVIAYAQETEGGVKSAGLESGAAKGDFVVVGQIVSAAPATGAWVLKNDVAEGAIGAMSGRRVSNKSLLIGSTYSNNEFQTGARTSAVVIFNGDIGRAGMNKVMNWLRHEVGTAAGIWE
ncbi:TPA: hypothetical protein ACR6ZI_000458 [Klebsiella pneumoniae]|uniref:hypothetical protein n=1 Tax=Klebsiella pneumoniae TaxID=573 RepID=UPI000C7DCDC1|nr:hypothetical protein [Klebsiella pneumoniae]ELF1740898.1 hypothetical protein [Klebsiella pneumoniae]PLI66499.1 hypothetical protein B6J50_16260 [Klebsiella pneumoniae]WKG41370.1 hypothetical protein QYQ86_23010 [Klebsiella pneumoniae]HBY6254653.1 hypothetical protein [Klebsiella pneumoniae]HCK7117280.1 hypothetical protein [Klebsiella pneumoniae]